MQIVLKLSLFGNEIYSLKKYEKETAIKAKNLNEIFLKIPKILQKSYLVVLNIKFNLKYLRFANNAT